MYLIKICPSCRTKLRFPIDKGKIRVKCACGHTFIANPDDTDLYEHASFDLSQTRCGLKNISSLRSAFSRIRFKQIIPSVITGILNIKYKLQNFRLLPDAEKKKIIATIIIVCAGIIGLIVTIYVLTSLNHAGDPIII